TGPSVGAGGEITGFSTGQAYTVTATNTGGCTSEISAQFTVEGPPDAPEQPTVSVVDATCNEPGSASITNYNSDYTYTFDPTGPSVGAGGEITGFSTGQAYTVTATNTGG
ncbi:hypothetical protein, partial [Maribellus maritimus]|uniref:hypothetical protein n=1 Tax=Maribellus maritimus TaxID=2870838 RepID=UPI001EEC535A